MKSLFLSRWPLLALALLALPSLSLADDRPHHYKGQPAETLEQAVSNFRDYNQKLAQLLEGDLSNADIAAIHETTYTLENSLKKLRKELKQLADTLEEIHVASEKVDRDTLKSSGAVYLKASRELENLGATKAQ